jgi:hypothetical protein
MDRGYSPSTRAGTSCDERTLTKIEQKTEDGVSVSHLLARYLLSRTYHRVKAHRIPWARALYQKAPVMEKKVQEERALLPRFPHAIIQSTPPNPRSSSRLVHSVEIVRLRPLWREGIVVEGESFRYRCESCANVSTWRCICSSGSR